MPTLIERGVRALLKSRGFQSRVVRTSVGGVHVMSKRQSSHDRTIALMHGLGASSAQLAPLLLRLSPHFDHLLAFDLPAHGFSDVPTPLDESTMETGIQEMLERTLTRPTVLFGNSMGGFAAIRFALARPDLVERLVLCSPGGAAMSPEELTQLRSIFKIESHQDAVAFLDRLFGRPPKLRQIYALGVRRKLNDDGLQKLLADVGPDRLLSPEEIRKIERPALVLWGKEDEILPKSGLAFFRAHLPQSEVVEIPGFGHSPHIEDPGEIAARILAFCDLEQTRFDRVGTAVTNGKP